MGNLFWFSFWGLLSLLAAAAGVRAYLRRRAALAALRTRIDDAAIRSIVETGSLSDDVGEPLDLDEIEAQEERFWSETWDEPEEV